MTKKVIENGCYMENEKAKVELEDIVGLIDCEPTDSVKEVKRLRGRKEMSKKRFEYKNHKVFDNLTGETHSSNMVSVNVLNDLTDEVMDLRAENTQFKLIVSDIVEDLEKQAKSKEPIILSEDYVKWIKKNVNLNFFSKKGDDVE